MRSILVTWLILLISTALAVEIGLSPPRVDHVAAAGSVVEQIVTIVNSGTSQQTIEVEVEDWTLDPNGGLRFLPVGSVATSANGWLELESGAFVVPASSSREFRFAYRIPADAGLEGTYTSSVLFRVVPDAADGAPASTARVAHLAYVTIAGTERYETALRDMTVEGDRVVVEIGNDGNTTVRTAGELQIRDVAGAVVASVPVPDLAVLRESDRRIALPVPELEPGFYVALALVRTEPGGLLVGELPFEVE